MLCSYMSIEAFMIAYRNNYPVLCAPFDTKSPPAADLLWLFYISKVIIALLIDDARLAPR